MQRASTTAGDSARSENDREHRRITVDGLRLRYLATGAGPPVLVLHGWGANINTVWPIMDALRNTCAVYTLDLPGFGQSDSPPTAWGAHDYAALVERFLNAVGLLRVSVVGHSFGGRIGIVLAAEYSDRVDKLVLIDSAGVRPRRGARYYLRVGTVKTAKLLRRVGGAWGTALHARIVRFVASSDYLAVNDVLRPTFVRVVNEDLRQLLPRLAPPTLLLWGSNDRETPLAHAKTMERLIPDAGLVVWEGAGHYSYLDEPVRSGRVLRQFLTGAP